MKACMIVLDALSGSAVDFLTEAIPDVNLRGEIIPPFSFEPDAAFLSGHYPDETNSGTHFWFAPESSPFGFLKGCGKGLDRLPYPGQLLARRVVRYWAEYRAAPEELRAHCHTARIPFGLVAYFAPVRKAHPHSSHFCCFPTTFDLLRENGKCYKYFGPQAAEQIFHRISREDISTIDFLYLFIGDLDSAGHVFGTKFPEYRRVAMDVASTVAEILNSIRKQWGDFRCIIFGDHGMVDVTRCVDVQKCLDQLSVRCPKDYVYFLDSTLARFWFFNGEAERQVTDLLSHLDRGHLVTDRERDEYHINYGHNRFGELIWWADGGTLILPNFWQGKKPVKGMHGYRKEVLENHAGFLLIDSKLPNFVSLDDPIEMVDIFATLVEALGLKMPEEAHGGSLI